MDTSIVNTQNSSNTEKDTNLNLDHPSINSHSPTFLLHEDFNSCQISDIEMITIQSVSYTSLKDLLPISLPTVNSPPKQNSSLYEITIKNPLVKQAALAYLQPMGSPPEVGEKGLLERIKESCSDQCGCVLSMCDLLWRNFTETFWKRKEQIDYDDYYINDEYKED